MIIIGLKLADVDYLERKSSYAVLKNNEGKIAVVNIKKVGFNISWRKN